MHVPKGNQNEHSFEFLCKWILDELGTRKYFLTTTIFSDSREDQGQAEDAALAQLIADSTEKRFKINNIFKVKWKKKHYSFDLS